MRPNLRFTTSLLAFGLAGVVAACFGCRPAPAVSSQEPAKQSEPPIAADTAIAEPALQPPVADAAITAAAPASGLGGQKIVPDWTRPSELAIHLKGGVDYASFKAVNRGLDRIPLAAFAACAPFPKPLAKRDYGPHTTPAVAFFANAEALPRLRAADTSALPVGATIVKEKWLTSDRPVAYAAMIKREPGYDPKHGDWEYVYATLDSKTPVERGLIKNCIDCHATAQKRDYVFRSWVEPREKPDESRQE